MKDREISLEQFVSSLARRATEVDLHGKDLDYAIKAEEQLKALREDGLRWRGTGFYPAFYEKPNGDLYYVYRVGMNVREEAE